MKMSVGYVRQLFIFEVKEPICLLIPGYGRQTSGFFVFIKFCFI